jgi:NAD(P)H-dependent FMN reductase
MHFRLLRHDCVEPLRMAVAAVCHAGGVPALVAADHQGRSLLSGERMQVMLAGLRTALCDTFLIMPRNL